MSIFRQFRTPKPVYLCLIALIMVVVFSIIFYGKYEIESSPYFSLVIQDMKNNEEIISRYGVIEDYELISFNGKNNVGGILISAEYIFVVKGSKQTGKLEFSIKNIGGEIEISHISVR